MAYQANKPASNDAKSVSCGDIRNNFSEINTLIGIDHVTFGTADAGKHLFNQAAAPGVASATQVGMYCAALAGNPELYINKLGSQIPFTKSVKATTGYTYLPSGILVQWGSSTIPAGSSTVTVTLVAAGLINFPTGYLTGFVTATQIPPASDVRNAIVALTAGNQTQISFARTTAFVNPDGTNFNYLVIGY